jgi:membrane protein
MKRILRDLYRAAKLMYESGGLGTSKGAAYSSLLSLFPVLTTLAALLVQARGDAVLAVLSSLLYEIVPPGTEKLIFDRVFAAGLRPFPLLVTAGVVSLWAASGLMLSLMEGFNAVYRVKGDRSLVHKRVVAALLVFCAALPAIGASVMILFGQRSDATLLAWLRGIPITQPAGGVVVLGQLVRHMVALAGVVFTACVLYVVGPYRKQRIRRVLPGALVATVSWLIATTGFSWYVRNIADYNVMYGSIGAAIALLVWMYVLAVIAITGCAFNAVREK